MLRYAVIVFLLLGVYPLLFAQTEKLWKKLGWLKKPQTVAENCDTQPVADDESEPTENADGDADGDGDADDTQTSDGTEGDKSA